jgi:hypothetical protein
LFGSGRPCNEIHVGTQKTKTETQVEQTSVHQRDWIYFINIKLHTYHSRLIPEGVGEVSQIFLLDTHVLPKLVMRNTADVTGGKPIAVLLQSISGVSAVMKLF